MILKSTYNELIKIIAKPRSYIGLGAITLIVGIILFAMKMGGSSYLELITQLFDQSILFEGEILNGNFICYLILQMLVVHIPLLIALVTGDLVSGENAMGTIRLLLTKPISRSKILLSKYFAGCIYTFIILCWIGFLSFLVSKFLFGSGDLMIVKTDGLVMLKESDLWWRFLASFGLAYVGLVMIATLSLTLSCFSENSIGPIVATMAIIILFTIIGALAVPVLDPIKPFLFTTHMSSWHKLFDDPLPFNEIIFSFSVLMFHIIVLLGISLYMFNKKDVLS